MKGSLVDNLSCDCFVKWNLLRIRFEVIDWSEPRLDSDRKFTLGWQQIRNIFTIFWISDDIFLIFLSFLNQRKFQMNKSILTLGWFWASKLSLICLNLCMVFVWVFLTIFRARHIEQGHGVKLWGLLNMALQWIQVLLGAWLECDDWG